MTKREQQHLHVYANRKINFLKEFCIYLNEDEKLEFHQMKSENEIDLHASQIIQARL